MKEVQEQSHVYIKISIRPRAKVIYGRKARVLD